MPHSVETDTQKQEEKQRRMTTEPPEKLICQLAAPTIVSMLITSFYNMADTFFIAKLENTSATGAVGVAFSLMAIIQAVGFFFGHGSGNFISRELGKKNVRGAEEMAATGFFSSFIAGLFILLAGMLFLHPLARLLGSTDTILPYAVEYLRIILIGAPYMCASLVLNNQLRFQSNAFFAMIGLTTGGILNLALDPLFIFGFDMGVTGAALATILSQLVSFILLFIGIQRSDSLKIRFRNYRPNRFYLKNIINGGTPSLCRQGLNSVSTIVLNTVAKGYGDAAIAAISIVSRIMMFASSAVIGFGQGFQPVAGYNYGAKQFDRVREAFRFTVKTGTVFLTCLGALGFWFAPEVISLFQSDDPAVIEIGATAFRAQCLALPLQSTIVLSNMLFQSVGKAFQALFISATRQGIYFLPLILILPCFFGLGGVEYTQPISDLLAFSSCVPFLIFFFRELRQREKQLIPLPDTPELKA